MRKSQANNDESDTSTWYVAQSKRVLRLQSDVTWYKNKLQKIQSTFVIKEKFATIFLSRAQNV